MKNQILPEELIKAVEKVLEDIEEVKTVFESQRPKNVEKSSSAEKIHSVIFLDTFQDFILHSAILKHVINVSEEKFIYDITQHGEMSLEEAETQVMNRILMDILTKR